VTFDISGVDLRSFKPISKTRKHAYLDIILFKYPYVYIIKFNFLKVYVEYYITKLWIANFLKAHVGTPGHPYELHLSILFYFPFPLKSQSHEKFPSHTSQSLKNKHDEAWSIIHFQRSVSETLLSPSLTCQKQWEMGWTN
jgi:hypothetical protein